jgi:hypothetical protein
LTERTLIHASWQYSSLFERGFIAMNWTVFCQARKLLRALREEKRREWAVSVIQKYYAGWIVRREYRHKFRAIAGPKIARFMLNSTVSLNQLLYFSVAAFCLA